ncbi:MAG TPA: tRNA pseudouridine(55) synthase TruB [Myxococcales bacterium]|nr:tRNA pseudouridine(55) synthase TruB [Myxococcales bacterium]
MNGVLVVDKPAGPTSFEVVQRVRSLLAVKKAGHTGTLDPMATGVLPVCLGEATKVAGVLTEGDKAYDAVIRLGVETDTQDAEGKVLAQQPVPPLDRAALEAALARFRGTFTQVPPMYSAVKVSGKRLYQLARAGEEVPREGREVTVHELLLRDFSATELTVSVRTSKGFFVRTLAHDLGKALGCGAHLKTLRRTASGPFTLQRAVTLDKLAGAQVEALVIPTSEALAHLPALTVSAQDEARVGHGVPLEAPAGLEGRVRVLGPGGKLLALAEIGRDRRLRYLRVLS